MKTALETLRTQVQNLSGRFSDQKKIRELENSFKLLEAEFLRGPVQGQRIMVLLRGIIAAQPGSAKAVNQFLRSPSIAQAMSAGGHFQMK